jgi:hypothetical protein
LTNFDTVSREGSQFALPDSTKSTTIVRVFLGASNITCEIPRFIMVFFEVDITGNKDLQLQLNVP